MKLVNSGFIEKEDRPKSVYDALIEYVESLKDLEIANFTYVIDFGDTFDVGSLVSANNKKLPLIEIAHYQLSRGVQSLLNK